MKKIMASCATLALFAQFTDAKVAGTPTQDKTRLETVSADECVCEKDPFSGAYISFGLGYGSTKDKLESDLTIIGTTAEAIEDADARNGMQSTLDNHNKGNGNLFDSLTGSLSSENYATVTARKHTTRNKNHHAMIGNAAVGWLWKTGSGYLGLEGNFGFGSDSITSLQFLATPHPSEAYHIDLKRSGTDLGLGALLGWKLGQSNLVYGKIGGRCNNNQVTPAAGSSYTKKTFAPEFGLGFKRVTGYKAIVGLEASYALNKKIKMNDPGKSNTYVPYDGDSGSYPQTLGVMEPATGATIEVDDNDTNAVVKSKRTGTWKVALTLTMPLG